MIQVDLLLSMDMKAHGDETAITMYGMSTALHGMIGFIRKLGMFS